MKSHLGCLLNPLNLPSQNDCVRMKKYKNIYFDLDRTIWDFDKNAIDTFKDIYQKYQLEKIFKILIIFMIPMLSITIFYGDYTEREKLRNRF